MSKGPAARGLSQEEPIPPVAMAQQQAKVVRQEPLRILQVAGQVQLQNKVATMVTRLFWGAITETVLSQ